MWKLPLVLCYFNKKPSVLLPGQGYCVPQWQRPLSMVRLPRGPDAGVVSEEDEASSEDEAGAHALLQQL
jgi:hypothetical protein